MRDFSDCMILYGIKKDSLITKISEMGLLMLGVSFHPGLLMVLYRQDRFIGLSKSGSSSMELQNNLNFLPSIYLSEISIIIGLKPSVIKYFTSMVTSIKRTLTGKSIKR